VKTLKRNITRIVRRTHVRYDRPDNDYPNYTMNSITILSQRFNSYSYLRIDKVHWKFRNIHIYATLSLRENPRHR